MLVQGELDDKDVGTDKNPHISIHATIGVTTTRYRTIRAICRAKKRPLHILMNSRSAQNFLDLETAKKLGCKITTMKPMQVDVVEGNNLTCTTMCKDLQGMLQGTTFMNDVLLLPLGIVTWFFVFNSSRYSK